MFANILYIKRFTKIYIELYTKSYIQRDTTQVRHKIMLKGNKKDSRANDFTCLLSTASYLKI